jgi:hypothetical protein
MSTARTLETPRRVKAPPKVKIDPAVRRREQLQAHNKQYDGLDDKLITTNKRFETVAAFDAWMEKVKQKPSMMKLYKDYKVEQLANGGVLVYRDLNNDGKYEAQHDRLVAVNGASVRTVKPDVLKPAGAGDGVKNTRKHLEPRSETVA